MTEREARNALRDSIGLDQWLAEMAGLAGNGALARALQARARDKQARLAALATDAEGPLARLRP